jgi:hypothetical protein
MVWSVAGHRIRFLREWFEVSDAIANFSRRSLAVYDSVQSVEDPIVWVSTFPALIDVVRSGLGVISWNHAAVWKPLEHTLQYSHHLTSRKCLADPTAKGLLKIKMEILPLHCFLSCFDCAGGAFAAAENAVCLTPAIAKRMGTENPRSI